MRISGPSAAFIAAFLLVAIPAPTPPQFSVSVGATIGAPPPPLPVYAQPPLRRRTTSGTPATGAGERSVLLGSGNLVAGASARPVLDAGVLASLARRLRLEPSYWGSSVGFYGGVNYGFGYYGTGFVAGVWAGNNFRYNTAVANVNRTVIHNTYVDKTVTNKNVSTIART